MRRQRPLILLAVLTLSGGLSACGADDELSTQIPRNAPDLTIPTATTEGRADATTPSTTTETSTTAGPATTPPAVAAPPATPPATATPPASSTTGGQAPTTGQSTTGGTQAGG
ncbi:MAG: hypothetical protein ACRDMZ_12340, partial [Solirubrobacteraceae bacterium]